jgi:ubiquinone/menaquinone biosynthesis C-methylase UbiE
MSSYARFAEYYDSLTRNVDYSAMAQFLCNVMEKHGHSPGLAVDLACGTGNLTLALAEKGWDIYGVDASAEMLSVAQQKAAEEGRSLLFLCQKLQNLDLYGTVDTALCAMDSLNHIVSTAQLQAAMQRIALFLNPGGYFVFDVNTEYKHQKVLGDNIFVYDTEDVYCVWQNSYHAENHMVKINLDFFAREQSRYRRSREEFFERAYSDIEIKSMLLKAGLEPVACYDGYTIAAPGATAERIVYIARKEQYG